MIFLNSSEFLVSKSSPRANVEPSRNAANKVRRLRIGFLLNGSITEHNKKLNRRGAETRLCVSPVNFRHPCKIAHSPHNTAGLQRENGPLLAGKTREERNFMKKLLVANRSEIAIRVFRAATELGLRTVAVYSYEDRFSLHRFKSDESFLIGPPAGGEPVRSYLNIENVLAV